MCQVVEPHSRQARVWQDQQQHPRQSEHTQWAHFQRPHSAVGQRQQGSCFGPGSRHSSGTWLVSDAVLYGGLLLASTKASAACCGVAKGMPSASGAAARRCDFQNKSSAHLSVAHHVRQVRTHSSCHWSLSVSIGLWTRHERQTSGKRARPAIPVTTIDYEGICRPSRTLQTMKE